MALGFYALGYYTVRHSVEIKPYAFDQFATLALLLPASLWLRKPDRAGPLWLLVAGAPVAVAASYPAVFVAGGVGVAVLPTLIRRRDPGACLAWVLFGVALFGSFLATYSVVGAGQYATTAAAMRECWLESFPPRDPLAALAWLVRMHTGNMFAYPAGGSQGGSAGTLLLTLVGGANLLRAPHRSFVILLVVPFLLTLVAAAMERYPYGGSARISQHLAPAICLLAGEGAGWLIMRRFKTPDGRQRAAIGAAVLLATFGVAGIVRDVQWPYKTLPDQQARAFVQEALVSSPDADVVVLQPMNAVPVNFQWYLRTGGRPIHWGARGAAAGQCWSGEVVCFNFEPADDLSLAARWPAILPPGHRPSRLTSASLQIGPVHGGPAWCQRALVAADPRDVH